jgi:hypothetical protein
VGYLERRHSNLFIFIFLVPPDVASKPVISDITTTTASGTWGETSGNFDSYKITITPLDNGANVDKTTVAKSVKPPKTTFSILTPGIEYTVAVMTVLGNGEGTKSTVKFTTCKL